MLTIEPKNKTVDDRLPCNIVVDGEVVGELEFFIEGDLLWHACIELGMGWVQIYGFGKTRAEAIVNAIRRGREQATLKLRLIDELEGKIG